MRKFLCSAFCAVLFVAFAGCAPQQAYHSADALGRTSSIAGAAAVSARRTANETGAAKEHMANDIKTLKETERLFDEQSGIKLSY